MGHKGKLNIRDVTFFFRTRNQNVGLITLRRLKNKNKLDKKSVHFSKGFTVWTLYPGEMSKPDFSTCLYLKIK